MRGTGVRVVVIGGGLAGITAAIALAESGADVTLLEARPRLGGATCSFQRDGLTVDTGQHVFLGCCSAYRGLLAKLGMTEHAPLQDRFDVTVLAPGRPAGQPGAGQPGASQRSASQPRRARLRRTALPGPLHMLPALGRYPFLSWAERAQVARPALAMRRVDPAAPAADTERFGDWLAARGQSERARRALWDLFSVSALNIAGDDASLALAATVVKTGLLGKNNAADIGVAALPLGELHGDAAATLLAKLGAQVIMGAKVSAIESGAIEGGAIEGGEIEVTEGQDARFRVRLGRAEDADLAADAVVLAVPHEKAAPLIPPDALPSGTVAGWAGLGASPIVNVHVIYDRPVTDLPFAAAIDSPVQWIFDRTRISGMTALATGAQGSTWPSRCRRPMSTRTCPRPGCASSSCPRWPNCSPRLATPGSPSSSSPASGGRPSARRRAAARCGRRPRPGDPAWCWRARGRTLDGRTRWKARCAVAWPRPWSYAIPSLPQRWGYVSDSCNA